jgi:hypothetical protein
MLDDYESFEIAKTMPAGGSLRPEIIERPMGKRSIVIASGLMWTTGPIVPIDPIGGASGRGECGGARKASVNASQSLPAAIALSNSSLHG